jgi:peptide-methionine (R)-S-oxide reductase
VKVDKTEQQWREQLTPQQYHVMREHGTELPWSGELNYVKDAGVYRCAGCGAELFTSGEKFESGSGWPSFFAPASEEAVETEDDRSLFTRRTEVHCASCGSHLGHVFEDGPHPTGLRYCINSVCLTHEPTEEDEG